MELFNPNDYHHVHYQWDDNRASAMDEVDRLVYRSNILGNDQRITNTGAGYPSKIMMTDPLTGETVNILWVKGFSEEIYALPSGQTSPPSTWTS
jgi:rhamnose utilization protein RhaD (predicted bifunctional aldolase and dehydrogenase)